MYKNVLLTAAIFGALAVALGAVGAHAFERILSDKIQKTYETAVRYQIYHSIAIAILGILIYLKPNSLFKWAAKLFTVGTVLFSGSLYLIIFLSHQQIVTPTFIGILTPLGGICFILGWIFFAIGTRKM